MKYIGPSKLLPGYHTFAHDEDLPGYEAPGGRFDVHPHELWNALHDICMHTNLVMADEIDEDPEQ